MSNIPKNIKNIGVHNDNSNNNSLIKSKHDFSLFSKNNKNVGFGILFNIIGFSYINNMYGMQLGDKVLDSVGFLLSSLGNNDIYKLDGDEFLLIIQNYDSTNAKKIFESKKNKMNQFFNKDLKINNSKIIINFKLVGGIFQYHTMLLNLNNQLRIVKEKKVDSSFIKNKELLFIKYNYIEYINILDNAIKNSNIFLEYQPIFDNKTETIYKYESLVRIKHKKNIIYPDYFIDISQKTNYYSLITKSIISIAFEKFYDKKDIEFSLNLDILDIENSETTDFIFSMLENFPHTQNITFELTEFNKIENFDILTDFIRKAKFFNVKIALDDFGSGYANFDLLAKIDFDFIKIDGSLIKNINDFKVLSIIKMLVLFAKANNVKTVAEYVSSEEIYQKVLQLGVDYSQGWHFGKSSVFLINK